MVNELIAKAQNGDKEAEERLIIDNDGLIRMVMKKCGYSVFNEDIHSVGMFGLWKAIKSFNPDKGFKFTTYATRVIINEFNMDRRKNNNDKRKTLSNSISIETVIGEKITIADMLVDHTSMRGYDIAEYPDLESVLSTLTPEERRLFDLKHIYCMTQREMIETGEYNKSQSMLARKLTAIDKKVTKKMNTRTKSLDKEIKKNVRN